MSECKRIKIVPRYLALFGGTEPVPEGCEFTYNGIGVRAFEVLNDVWGVEAWCDGRAWLEIKGIRGASPQAAFNQLGRQPEMESIGARVVPAEAGPSWPECVTTRA